MAHASPGGKGSGGDWVSVRRDAETGIETIRAHFTGHAYDPHDHDDVLVGITEQGVQEFRCRRRLHTSTPGRVILIEPGEVHDGHSPRDEGFTYAMLYLPARLLAARADALRELGGGTAGLGFRDTLSDDRDLAAAIRSAFLAVHGGEGRLARDLGLDGLAGLAGVDRFRLNRVFRGSFGQSPHAYLVRLRLKAARRLLAHGAAPAAVAAEVGFADQSHLGRWFRRAYGMTSAAYRRICTNVPD